MVEGRLGHSSGGVERTVGTPSMYCTIGGENQCPLPLYQSTTVLKVDASDASIEPILRQGRTAKRAFNLQYRHGTLLEDQ